MPRDVETLASKIAHHQALTELDATGWIIRLAKALEPIHALGVAHGNITAEALRLDGVARTSRAVLADARHLSELPPYHSPERAGGEGASVADDTWAVGVILYLALTGSFPFPGASDAEVRAKIFGPPAAPLAVFDVGDDGLQQILDRAFARDAAERLGNIRELREALEEWHPDPDVKNLPPLDDDDGEPSGGAFPAISRGIQAHGQVSRAQPPVVRAAPIAQATPVVPAAPIAQATPAAPAASMSHSGLLPASDEEDGPTQVRGASSVHQYLAALQATPGPAAPPLAPAPVAATPGTPAPAIAAAPATERGSRLRRLPAPMPPPMKQSPSVAPGPMALSALATSEFPSAERSGLARAGLFDDEEPTMFAVPSSLARPRPEPSPEPAPEPAASSRAPMFPSPAPPVAATEAPSNASHAALAGPAPVAANHPPSSAGLDAPSSTALDAPAPQSEAQGKSRSRTPLLAGLVLLLAGAAAVVFLVGSGASPEQPTSTPSASAQLSANPSSSAVAAAPPPGAAVSASPSTAVSASPTAAVSASPSTAVSASPTAAVSASATASPDVVAACLMPMFAAGTFAAPPASLASLCAITDPRKGGETIRTEVILGGAGRNVSDGMREWGVLGLYEMAAFAILRASCCPSAAALDIPISVPTCDIESPLKSLAEAASSATATDAAVDDALKAYTKEARCISRAGASSAYGQKSRLQGGELETFQKTLDRARAVVKKK